MNRIGILGGTFDPIHNAHLEIAQTVRDALQLDEVWIIPDGSPPHKQASASMEDRMHMAALAVADIAGFRTYDIEIRRAGITYTVDTLTQLQKKHFDCSFTYIIGGDAFSRMEHWRGFRQIAGICDVAVIGRGAAQSAEIRNKADSLAREYGICIWVVPGAESPISSSEIRRSIARGISIEQALPEAVREYITRHYLYRDEHIDKLRASLTPDRYQHTLGVEETAVALARCFGADPAKAGLAALYHDCAKCAYTREQMLAICESGGIELSQNEREITQVLHAPAGAVIAKREYGITDTEVLQAIRWHTTGRRGMTLLEKVVYLADAIEPYRKPYPGLAYVRELAKADLDAAICQSACDTREYVAARALPLNPNTEAMILQLKSDGGKEQ